MDALPSHLYDLKAAHSKAMAIKYDVAPLFGYTILHSFLLGRLSMRLWTASVEICANFEVRLDVG